MNMQVTDKKKRRKLFALVLTLAAIGCCVAAYFHPIWGFYLYAPQYPRGLTLAIYIDRLAGDTMEIDILNHYIGMAKLGAAAQWERTMAVYVLVAISISKLFVPSLPDRRQALLAALPAMVFPFVFTLIMFVWMYKFGHELDPAAPVHMAPFTPELLGQGIIGNFKTYGMPGPGFYLLLVGACLTAIAARLRWLDGSLPKENSQKPRGWSALGSRTQWE
jgi:hypothetical protein